MKGWVKIHRSILKSGTFKKLNLLQQLIALYIIINANHEDGVWHDKYKNISVPVKRGEQVVSIDKIIGWFDDDKEVTIAKVRKTLEKLIANGFITTRTTNNYTVINVVNYGIYQDKEEENNKQDNKEITKGKQRDDKGITTNKNDKNDNNDNNEKKEDDKELTVVANAKPKNDDKHKERDINFLIEYVRNNYNGFSDDFFAVYESYLYVRKKKKATMSINAIDYTIKQLKKKYDSTEVIISALEYCIETGYTGFFYKAENEKKQTYKNTQQRNDDLLTLELEKEMKKINGTSIRIENT